MAPLKKPPGQKVGRTPNLVVPMAGNMSLALCPAGSDWPESHVVTWLAFWASPLANTMGETDVPGLYRLWELRIQADAFNGTAAREGYMVEGAKGQPAAHPLLAKAQALLAPIAQLEREYGLTPVAKVRLGLSTAKAHKTLADMSKPAKKKKRKKDPRG